MKTLYLFLCCMALLPCAAHAVTADATGRQPLTLKAALAKAAAGHPALSAAASEWQAVRAEAVQAGLRLNPVFGAEVENVFGSGGFSDVDAAEYTFSLSQTVELGNKRNKREKAALLQGEVAGWSLEERRRAIEQQTLRLFYTALAAQSRLELSARQVKLAQSVVDKARLRVDAGRANQLEVSRARIELADAQLEQKTMAEAFISAKQQLVSQWGGSAEETGALAGSLEPIEAPESVADLSGCLQAHPAYHQATAAVQQAQALVISEDARRIPDIDISAGFRRIGESDDQAFVAGLSIPLAFGNRNQGNREAARMRVRQAREQLFAVTLKLNQALMDQTRAVRMAYETVLSLENQQLPLAREAFAQASDGYEKGLFSSLDLLDAMRGLFSQETRHVNALLDYHQARAELNMLIAPATEQKPHDVKE